MKKPFAGNFERGKSYLLKGDTILDWKKAYYADRVEAGRGIRVAGTPQGRVFHATAQNADAQVCVLGDMEVDPNNAGKRRIAPGYISGGGKSLALSFENVTPTVGYHVYVVVDWTAVVEDGRLKEGGTMDDASITMANALPLDDEFTKDDTVGKCYIPLGQWSNENGQPLWTPAGCGSIGIKFCPGAGFYFWRI